MGVRDTRHVTLIVTEVLVNVLRQRLWFPTTLARCSSAAVCTRARRRHYPQCNVAQWVEQAAHGCSVEGSTPSIATTCSVVTGRAARPGVRFPLWMPEASATAGRKSRNRSAPSIPGDAHASERPLHRSAYHACASMLDVRPVRRESIRRSVRAREARTMTTAFPPATATKNAIPVR